MDRDALNKLLGLRDKPTIAKAPARLAVQEVDLKASKAAAVSPTALRLDGWDLRRGQECLRRSPELRAAQADPLAVADLFAAAFLHAPELTDACADRLRQLFVKTLLETPDFTALRVKTCQDEFASEQAALQLHTRWLAFKEERQGHKSPTTPKEEADEERACLLATAAAAEQADEEVGAMFDAAQGLGMGGDGGIEGQKMDPNRVARAFRRVRDNPLLRRICELAGRYRRCAQARQRQKVFHGYDDMIGCAPTNDPAKLLTSELARLDDEDLELELLERLTGRRAMGRQYEGVEKLGKGPIVIVVDESGSMHGEPVCHAKAFALSMAWIARHQQRWVALVGFAGGTAGTCLAMPPNKWDESALLDWLGHFFSGGTCMDVPLDELPNVYWPRFVAQGMKRGATDIIMITDAAVRLPGELRDRFNAWKAKEKAKVITLAIGHDPRDLRQVSDIAFSVKGIDLHSEAVQECMGI